MTRGLAQSQTFSSAMMIIFTNKFGHSSKQKTAPKLPPPSEKSRKRKGMPGYQRGLNKRHNNQLTKQYIYCSPQEKFDPFGFK